VTVFLQPSVESLEPRTEFPSGEAVPNRRYAQPYARSEYERWNRSTERAEDTTDSREGRYSSQEVLADLHVGGHNQAISQRGYAEAAGTHECKGCPTTRPISEGAEVIIQPGPDGDSELEEVFTPKGDLGVVVLKSLLEAVENWCDPSGGIWGLHDSG